MLLNILDCTQQLHTAKNHLVPNVNSTPIKEPSPTYIHKRNSCTYVYQEIQNIFKITTTN